ncbi:CLUMA_CG006146, isoform A [Clunio marinus]|uniref:CLUMA_CG006146, isoform A n=1 Tax=Clunio marinus TaxID=568069 RepID=A0A1J1I181_9DIPT|nr:CLUMA_CG006146, isoform A [Clunio marinus]
MLNKNKINENEHDEQNRKVGPAVHELVELIIE